ncbi:probable disease resistance protein At4g27220 [Prosopis cineraria]|uniref:probable disease resistance protein At4g27220 n=1 Tax=Prosopis cineraria TaxID=364024 RepID=UPI0024100734|nr:probable disease resistance protein At4g27220 [Prosopis cineraria]
MKALQDNNCNRIGLHGMGGAGKTSMAKEVACKLKDSELIDKVIFLVVSKPLDFKKILGELAKALDVDLEKVNEEELSHTICARITHMEEKLLIILDVWEEFDLTKNLGIPSDHQHKSCNILITTRNLRVCTELRCQTIELQTLNDEEALGLFKAHASINKSTRGLKGMPEKIVKHCGGVPVAIVAIARALKNQPTSVWKDALKTLEDHGVDQNLEEAYKCLKLSYDNLKHEKAKELLMISSLFPEDYEIPIQLLIKIGIGLGSCGENDEYHFKRNEVCAAIAELIYSSLLLNGEEECVKMHDLVREVTLWIGDNDIKSIVDLKIAIKKSLRYFLWKNDDFPVEFDGEKLEVLLIFLDGSKDLEVSKNAFLKEMTKLKVLILYCSFYKRIQALSLTNSLQSLKDIRTLILKNLKLGDISILENLLSL